MKLFTGTISLEGDSLVLFAFLWSLMISFGVEIILVRSLSLGRYFFRLGYLNILLACLLRDQIFQLSY